MTQVEAILLLLAVTTLLVAVARRIGIPYPILLVIGGLGIGVTPWIPNIELKPEYVFVLILPPILQSAAFFTPVRDFRTHLRSILSLAVGLVLVSTVVVAAVAHLVVDGLSWPAAFVLGAISCFEQPERADRRELAVIGWAGMRGVVSLAAALALEPDVPGRDLILFLTFAVILVTLVLQGLTLAPLTRWLGVTGDGEEALEDLEARTAMAIAARRRLEELSSEPWTLDHIVEDLALHLDTRVSGLRAKSDDDQDGPSQETERLADIGRKLQRELIQAELTEAIRLRDAGRINDTTLRGLQRDLDVERVRLERV